MICKICEKEYIDLKSHLFAEHDEVVFLYRNVIMESADDESLLKRLKMAGIVIR